MFFFAQKPCCPVSKQTCSFHKSSATPDDDVTEGFRQRCKIRSCINAKMLQPPSNLICNATGTKIIPTLLTVTVAPKFKPFLTYITLSRSLSSMRPQRKHNVESQQAKAKQKHLRIEAGIKTQLLTVKRNRRRRGGRGGGGRNRSGRPAYFDS